MTKKLLSLALTAILLAALIPAALADSERTMYVYTENGKSLNVRRTPEVADNIVAQAKYGDPVTVVATSANGWSTIWWQDNNGEFHYYYVQSRFLVNYKPGAKPTTSPSTTPDPSEAERIATCPQGKELTVLVEMKNWYQVQDPETGMIGFISNKYVTRK